MGDSPKWVAEERPKKTPFFLKKIKFTQKTEKKKEKKKERKLVITMAKLRMAHTLRTQAAWANIID